MGERPVNEPGSGFDRLLDSWAHSAWHLSSQGNVNSRNLADHLGWLLDRLAEANENLRHYLEEHDVAADFFCFLAIWTQGSLHVDPSILTRLSVVGVPINIDIYQIGDD